MGSSPFFFKAFIFASSAYTLIPFFISIKHFKFLKHETKILFYLLSISVLTEIISHVAPYIFKTHNLRLLNAYIIIESALIGIFYISIFVKTPLKILSSILVLSYTIFAVLHFFVIAAKTLDHVVLTIESAIVILFSVIGFHHLLKYSSNKNILTVPLFWFNSAFLIYFSGNLFLHIFSKYLQEHALYTFFELWSIWHSLLNIMFYTLLSIGFWKTRTLQISNS